MVKSTGSKQKKQAKITEAASPRNQLKKLPSSWLLTKHATRIILDNWKLFLGITAIYGFLNLLLVQGLAASTDVGSLKDQLNQIFTGNIGSLISSLGVFVVLVGSAGNSSNQTAGAYQFFLFLIASLAIICALRQVTAGSKLKIRDAFYKGMYPLVPFLLVLLIIGLQLLPLLIGSSLYSIVMTNGIAVIAIEKILWFVLFILLGSVSFYLVSSSLFALYIVTLPEMTPLKSLRSAKQLVQYRRWAIIRKVLYLPLFLFIVAAVCMIPFIILLTPLAPWVFFIMSMFGLVAVHSYLYALYRELLND